MHKAIFIDKDGTLIKNIPYNVDPSRIELSPDAGPVLNELQNRGYKVLVVSNQSGVAKGLFTEDQLWEVEQEINHQLAEFDVKLDDFLYCPHLPVSEAEVKVYAQECECRKPKAGLLFKAADQHQIRLKESWMIGDILHDVEAGNRAGCSSILLDNGGETEWVMTPERTPAHVVEGFKGVPGIIL